MIGSHSQHVVALNAHSGELLWLCRLPGRVESSAAIYARNRKIVVGKCFYIRIPSLRFVSHFMVSFPVAHLVTHYSTGCYDGRVYALSLQTGAIFGSVATEGEVKASPCIDEDHGYAWVRINNCAYAFVCAAYPSFFF